MSVPEPELDDYAGDAVKRTRVKRVNPQRKAREFARCYGSKERVEWVKTLPCAACGIVGYSQNAHVGRAGRGAGRRGDASQIAPLCSYRVTFVIDKPVTRGCHQLHDEQPAIFASRYPDFDATAACARVASLWAAHQEGNA